MQGPPPYSTRKPPRALDLDSFLTKTVNEPFLFKYNFVMTISTCVYHLAPATLRYLHGKHSLRRLLSINLREDLADATKNILNTLLMSPVHMLQCYDASDIHVHQMQCA